MIICPYCNVQFKRTRLLETHIKRCELNPTRTVRTAHNKGMKSDVNRRLSLEKYPNEKIFVENGTFARHSLKSRIIQQSLIPYECAICHMGPVWNGQPMSLILDHINGVNNDNRLSNLRFVCHNCDSQLPTYKSRNRKKNN